MSLWTVIIVVLLVVLLLGAPGVGIQHGYGWYPSGGVGLLLLIVILLLLFGR